MCDEPKKAKGSLKHIQWYVNERPDLLDAAIFSASPTLASLAQGSCEWVSPLADDKYLECWNKRFLERLDLLEWLDAFRSFWPFAGSGTPHWDALAKVPLEVGSGVVMLEAKAHKNELDKPKDRAGATAKDSRELIEASCAAARRFYCVPPDTRSWEDSYYQVGNRLAHLWWMHVVPNVPTWLVWVFFTNDHVTWNSDALAAHQWHHVFATVKQKVGLRPGHPLENRIAAAYLPPSPEARCGQHT
jgi:hypothetical protein